MDLADLADKQIEDRLQMALAQVQSNKNPSVNSAGYSLICETCGNPIPPERRKALPECATCVDCANAVEQANRLWRKDTGPWRY